MTEEKIVVKLKRLHPDAVLPTQGTSGASGFDLVALEEMKIEGRRHAIVSTGIAIEIPPGYEAQVRPRSGLAAKHGITVLNSPGTIDADYRGELKVILYNTGSFYTVNKGDKIAQIVIQKVPDVRFEECDELSSSDRGASGFGSTGR